MASQSLYLCGFQNGTVEMNIIRFRVLTHLQLSDQKYS